MPDRQRDTIAIRVVPRAGRDEIVSALQQTFLAEAGTVAADVDGLIARLEAAGLLQCQA